MIADYIEKEKLQDVKLEDISFDKRFNVYTKDQVEARYLTTPTFMERLKNLLRLHLVLRALNVHF